VSVHVLKIKHLDWAQSYEPRGRGFESCRARHFTKTWAIKNQVLLDAVGPLWDSLSTVCSVARAWVFR